MEDEKEYEKKNMFLEFWDFFLGERREWRENRKKRGVIFLGFLGWLRGEDRGRERE